MKEKRQLLKQVVAALSEDLNALTESQKKAAEGVTHEDAKQEGDKDMRSTEASYVARGLARRVEELSESLRILAGVRLPTKPVRVGIGVFVELEDEETEVIARYFVLPTAGGLRLKIQEGTMTVLTPSSPLGKSLLGKHLDDEVTVQTPGGSSTKLINYIG